MKFNWMSIISHLFFTQLFCIIFVSWFPQQNLEILIHNWMTISSWILSICSIGLGLLSILFSLGGQNIFKKIYFFHTTFPIKMLFNCSFIELDWLEWNIFRHYSKDEPLILRNNYFTTDKYNREQVLSPIVYILDSDPSNEISTALSLCQKEYLLKFKKSNSTAFIMTRKLAKIISPQKEYMYKPVNIKYCVIHDNFNIPDL